MTALWKEINKIYIRTQNYCRTCIVLRMKWDDAQKGPWTVPRLQWIFSEGTLYSALSAILHTSKTIYLKKWSRILDCLSLKLTIYWIEHQTFCSIFPALNLVPRPGFYHLWYLLLAKPLPWRLGNHQLFKQCCSAFRGNLEEEVGLAGEKFGYKTRSVARP